MSTPPAATMRFGKVTVKVSPTCPMTLSFNPPFEFQTKQSELTRFFGPTAVITMVSGVQPTPQATLIPTGVSVTVPDLRTVKLVTIEVLITPVEGDTAAVELAMVICEGQMTAVGFMIEFTQVTSRLGKATVKVDPILPVNDATGSRLV